MHITYSILDKVVIYRDNMKIRHVGRESLAAAK